MLEIVLRKEKSHRSDHYVPIHGRNDLSRRRWHRLGLWVGFFRESWSPYSLFNSQALQLYPGPTEGCPRLENDWKSCAFRTSRRTGTAVACTAQKAWIYYGE